MQEDNYSGIVKRVAGYLKLAKANRNPAAFLTGAGASISAKIPSASKLVEQVALEFSHCIEELSSADCKDYGKCMSALSPDERRMLIKPHLDNAKINWGHIALAQIIKNGFVSRVLTFNFDLVLESALSLIGQQCPVYDFGAYPKADLALLAEPSIIHLHGQSYGFVHLNTAEETQAHKDAISPIITNTINTRPTIIIGYSGACDPSALTLQEQYSNQHRLAWLDYSKIANDQQIKLAKLYNYAEFSGGLDFDLFMIALATELQIWPPKILTNSSSHLLDELSIVTDYPTSDGEELDIFSRVKEHLREQKDDLIVKAAFEGSELPPNASKQDKELHSSIIASKLISEAKELQSQALNMTGASKVDAFENAIEKFKAGADIKPNSIEGLENWAYTLLDLAEFKSNKQASKLLRRAITICKKSVKLDPNNFAPYNNWGNALSELAKFKSAKEAKALIEQSIEKYETSIKLNPDHYIPYHNLGTAFLSLAEVMSDEESLQFYHKAIEQFKSALNINPDLTHAYVFWGLTLAKMAVQKTDAAADSLFTQAIEKCEIAIEKDPDYKRYHYHFGRIFALKRDKKRMLEALEQAKAGNVPRLKAKILNQDDFKFFNKNNEMQAFIRTLYE